MDQVFRVGILFQHTIPVSNALWKRHQFGLKVRGSNTVMIDEMFDR